MAPCLLMIALVLILTGCDTPPRSFTEALRQMSRGDYQQAAQHLRLLAENGYPPAQFRFGLLHLYGKGMRQNPPQAAYWLQRAAQQDDIGAQYVLARLYLTGLGVPQSDALGFRWMQRLAEQGFVPAQYEVGLFYGDGKGVGQDNARALYWLEKAADKGHPQAIAKMADAHRRGLLGLPQNAEQAAYWQQRARPKPF